MRVIGHRGASASAPENTLEAIDLALAQGADGAECDVRSTSDGVLVLLHDPTVDRTTDGTGPMAAMTWAEASALDAGFRHRNAAGEAAWRGRGVRIPTVEQALDAVAGRGRVVLEIKGHSFEPGHDPAEDLPERLADLLAGRSAGGRGDDVVVSSVNYVWLERVRLGAPGVSTALLVPAGLDPLSAVETAAAAGHAECHVAETLVGARVVAASRDAEVGVVAWTVNEPARARELEGFGIDGVITDDPKNVLAFLGRG
jgi:glycerophosphoryl diester phosphodiesterase